MFRKELQELSRNSVNGRLIRNTFCYGKKLQQYSINRVSVLVEPFARAVDCSK